MSRAEHDARNLAQVEMRWAELDTTGTVGSGWNPSAWCPACHAPYRAELPSCPECAPDHERRVLILFHTYRSLRGLHVTRVLHVSADTAARLLGRLEQAGHVVAHAGRWHVRGN